MHLLHLASVTQWLRLTDMYTCSLLLFLPTQIPLVAGQQCNPLYKAAVNQRSALPTVPAAVSNQPSTMLFEGYLEQQDALALLDFGASASFISKKAPDIGKLTLNPTEAKPCSWYCQSLSAHCREELLLTLTYSTLCSASVLYVKVELYCYGQHCSGSSC